MAEQLNMPWPQDTDVLVLPGVPGRMEQLSTGEEAYPSETSDVVKLLSEHGLRVCYATASDRRARVAYKSADLWFPVLVFSQQALASGAGQILASIVLDRIGATLPGRARLHVKLGKLQHDRTSVEWFEADGPADQVLAAIREAFGRGSS